MTAVTASPDVVFEAQHGAGWIRLDPSAPNPGFTELGEVTFRVSGGEELRLLVDDEPLEAKGPGEWRWKPGFYAGLVRAELVERSGNTVGYWRLDVSPDRHKLGEDLFTRMVDEILDHDPVLVIGAEPARRRLGALGETDDPLVALERLRRRESTLLRALAAIHREPRSVLRSKRDWVPVHRVRRADLRTLRAASREPAALATLPGTRLTGLTGGSSGQPFLDVPTVEHSLDSPANRAALFMLRALRRRASSIREQLEQQVQKESQREQARTGIGGKFPRWKEILERMSRSFKRAERQSPFRETRRPEITAAGLNAVAAHPVYAQFWRVGWEALRRGVYRLDARDELPLSPTWEIYERWCFVELARRLRERLPSPKWNESRRSSGNDRREIRFSRDDGTAVSLFLQKTAPRNGATLRSVSCQFVPDLVLRWEGGPSAAGFLVLDAKYRAKEQAILRGMAESAHPYQDALRWGNERPEATLLLVPDTAAAEWLSGKAFIEKNSVGAVRLLPNVDLPDWLSQFMLDRLHASATVGDRLRRARGAGKGNRTTDEIMELTRGED